MPIERSVIKIGRSLAITIPKDWFELQGIEPGDKVLLEIDKEVKVKKKDE